MGAACALRILFAGQLSGLPYGGVNEVMALLMGAIVLLWFDVITLRIPAALLLTFGICAAGFGGLDPAFLWSLLCEGGLILGAFFMATDCVTSPLSREGQVVYGICLGLLTAVFRLFGNFSEGIVYAVVLGNLLVPVIEHLTLPTRKIPQWKRKRENGET